MMNCADAFSEALWRCDVGGAGRYWYLGYLFGLLDQVNIAMLFLLAVVLVAFRFGRNPAILSSVLAVFGVRFSSLQHRAMPLR